MNNRDIFTAIFDRFERILRWVYPGLVFLAGLPFALNNITCFEDYSKFYEDVSWPFLVALILASGFLIYMIERYVFQEPLMGLVLFHFHMGAAWNFHDNEHKCYPKAVGRAMWHRFGERPGDRDRQGRGGDGKSVGERAEDRFDNYMMDRMGRLHALGCIWIIGITLYFIGRHIVYSSTFRGWSGSGVWCYWGIIISLILAWVWQIVIAARADQAHYVRYV